MTPSGASLRPARENGDVLLRSTPLAAFSMLLGALPALSAADVTARPPIIPQASIRGVSLDMTPSEVRSRLGAPSASGVAPNPIIGKVRIWRYPGLRIVFDSVKAGRTVLSVTTTSRNDRTGTDVGVGSRRPTCSGSCPAALRDPVRLSQLHGRRREARPGGDGLRDLARRESDAGLALDRRRLEGVAPRRAPSCYQPRPMTTNFRPALLLLLLAAVLASLAVAGCGSSDPSQADKAAELAAEQQKNPPKLTEPRHADGDAIKVTPGAGEARHLKEARDPEADRQGPTTLIVQDLIVGTGAEAKSGDTVDVQYVGVLRSNGKEFDSSWSRGSKPFSFALGAGSVIAGWDNGVVGMKVGGRRRADHPGRSGLRRDGLAAEDPRERRAGVRRRPQEGHVRQELVPLGRATGAQRAGARSRRRGMAGSAPADMRAVRT